MKKKYIIIGAIVFSLALISVIVFIALKKDKVDAVENNKIASEIDSSTILSSNTVSVEPIESSISTSASEITSQAENEESSSVTASANTGKPVESKAPEAVKPSSKTTSAASKSTASQKSSETAKPAETKTEPDIEETPSYSQTDMPENRKAGNFVSKNLVTVDKSADYDSNLGKLNKMIWETYGFTYTPFLTQNGTNRMVGRLMYDSENNRYGFKYTSWRKSYDTSLPQNNALNIVLETFYFFTGDKEVAKALWSWIDDSNVNHRKSNTDNFGFTDVGPDGNQFIVTMNGINIGIDEST